MSDARAITIGCTGFDGSSEIFRVGCNAGSPCALSHLAVSANTRRVLHARRWREHTLLSVRKHALPRDELLEIQPLIQQLLEERVAAEATALPW